MKDIIADESVLLEAHIPERMFHRDGQRDALVSCLKPVLSGKKALNAFLYGPTGTGKTALTKMIMERLKEKTSRVKITYVNCWQKSLHSLLSELVEQMDVFLTGKESTDSLFDKLEKHKGIITLDEVDQLKEDALYRFARSPFSLVCVSNDPNALMHLDYRVKSSLTVEPIRFPAYKSEQVMDILKDRTKFALRPGSVSPELLKMIAENSSGDARVALACLRTAATKAEGESEKVRKGDVKEALKEAEFIKRDMKKETLDQDRKALLDIVKESGGIYSSDLYEKYKQAVEDPVGKRMYRHYLKDLIEKNLLKEEGKGRWRKLS